MSSQRVTDEELMEHARQAIKTAYAPYSQFYVGAAVLTKDGSIFAGGNVENASYGLTVCAERVAVFKAVSEGHKRITAIAVTSSAEDKQGTGPCGACRQVLREFGQADMRLILEDADGLISVTLDEVLPRSFGPEHLGHPIAGG
jgi:cytidine deaminase